MASLEGYVAFGTPRLFNWNLRDRVVLVTDGMAEHIDTALDLPKLIATTRALQPRGPPRSLADMVRQATGGPVADDARTAHPGLQ